MSVKTILKETSFDDQTKNVFCNSLTSKKFKTNEFLMSATEVEPATPDTPNKILYSDETEKLTVLNSDGDKHGVQLTYFSNGTLTQHLDNIAFPRSLLDLDVTHAQGDILSRPNVSKDGTIYKIKIFGLSNISVQSSGDFVGKIGNIEMFRQSVTFNNSGSFSAEIYYIATQQNDDAIKFNFGYDIQTLNNRFSNSGQPVDTFSRLATERLDVLFQWNGQGLNNELVTVMGTLQQLN